MDPIRITGPAGYEKARTHLQFMATSGDKSDPEYAPKVAALQAGIAEYEFGRGGRQDDTLTNDEGLGPSAEQQAATASPELAPGLEHARGLASEAQGLGQLYGKQPELGAGAGLAGGTGAALGALPGAGDLSTLEAGFASAEPQYQAPIDIDPSAPEDEFTRDWKLAKRTRYTDGQPQLPSATKNPLLFRPPMNEVYGGLGGANAAMWAEPDIDVVREFLRPYLGADAEKVTENSEEYRRAADFLYARDYDKFTREGRAIERAAYSDAPAAKGIGATMHALAGLGVGAGNLMSFGATRAIPTFRDVEKQNPGAAAIGGLLGAFSPWSLPGAMAHKLTGAGKAMLGGAEASLGRRTLGGALGGAATGLADSVARSGVDLARGEDVSLAGAGTNAALGVLLGGVLGGITEPYSATARRAAEDVRSPGSSFDAMLKMGEKSGHELSGAGGARMSPDFRQLVESGADEGLSPVEESLRRAMRSVPDERQLAMTIQQSGNLPVTLDAFAQDIAPVLSTTARQHQQDALDVIRNAEKVMMNSPAGRMKQTIAPVANRLFDESLKRGKNKTPFVDLGDLPDETARANEFTVYADRELAARAAERGEGRLVNSLEFARHMDPVMQKALEYGTLVVPRALARDFTSGNAWVVAWPKKMTLAEFENDLMEGLSRKAKAASDDPKVDSIYRDLLEAGYDTRDRWKVRAPEEFANMHQNVMRKERGIRSSSSFASEPTSRDLHVQAPLDDSTVGVARKMGYGAEKRRIAEMLDAIEGRNYKAGLPKKLEFPRSLEGFTDEEAALLMRESPPALKPEEEQALLASLKGFRSKLDPEEEGGVFDARGGRDAATRSLLNESPLYERKGMDSPGFGKKRAEAMMSLTALSAKNRLAESGGVQAVLQRLGTPLERPDDWDNLYEAAATVTSRSQVSGGNAEFNTAVQFIRALNGLGGSREAALNKLQNIPRVKMLDLKDEVEGLFGPDTWAAVQRAWEGEKFKAQVESGDKWRAAMTRVPGMPFPFPAPRIGVSNMPRGDMLRKLAYPTMRALGSGAAEFPTAGPGQAQRFGRSLALRGEPTRLPVQLPAWMGVFPPERKKASAARKTTGSKR